MRNNLRDLLSMHTLGVANLHKEREIAPVLLCVQASSISVPRARIPFLSFFLLTFNASTNQVASQAARTDTTLVVYIFCAVELEQSSLVEKKKKKRHF